MNYITAAHTIDGYKVAHKDQYTAIREPSDPSIKGAKEKEQTVTRLEIINEAGRVFVDTKSTYTLSFQDNNQTLKLFKKKAI